jgi:hypothetical protein
MNIGGNSCRDRENFQNGGSLYNYNKFNNLMQSNDTNTINDSNYNKNYVKVSENNSRITENKKMKKSNQIGENLDTPKKTAETETVPENRSSSSSECESVQEQSSQKFNFYK